MNKVDKLMEQLKDAVGRHVIVPNVENQIRTKVSDVDSDKLHSAFIHAAREALGKEVVTDGVSRKINHETHTTHAHKPEPKGESVVTDPKSGLKNGPQTDGSKPTK